MVIDSVTAPVRTRAKSPIIISERNMTLSLPGNDVVPCIFTDSAMKFVWLCTEPFYLYAYTLLCMTPLISWKQVELKLCSLCSSYNDIKNILVEFNTNYMFPYLEIKLYRDFEKNILPKIDALATEQNRTRSDMIRDILYARFGYISLPRSQDQVNEDHAAERQEGKSVQHRCIIIRVDREYRDMFFQFIVEQPGRLDRNYRRYLNQTFYHYFGMAAPTLLH